VTNDQSGPHELADSESGNPWHAPANDIFLRHDKFVGGSGSPRGVLGRAGSSDNL